MDSKITGRHEYDSLSALVSYLDSTPDIKGAGQQARQSGATESWDLNTGWTRAHRMAAAGGGWQEGANKMRRGVAAAQAKHTMGAAPLFGNDVAGFAVDVPAYLAGQPDCMMTMAETEVAQAPIVRIAVGTFSCGVSADAAMNRGIDMMCLVDALEGAGHRCEVDAYWDAQDDGQHWQVRVRIKSAGEQWTPATAAFLSAHPAAFRRLGFSEMEKDPTRRQMTAGGGYGHGSEEGGEEYDIPSPYMRSDGGFESIDGALRTMQTRAKNAGYEVTLIEE